MKHLRKGLLTIFLFSIPLLIVGCIEESVVESESESYVAKISDFENNIFTNSQNQSIGLFENELRITGIYDTNTNTNTSLDKIIASIYDGSSDQVEKIFANAEIKTKNDQYFITADEGINLVFTKVGERIIKDEEGMEYSTPIYPE